ncbi:DUF4214 domain-containing protein [Rugamonas aquatica]|uniref:DUF4214 domain-containing protein n=1 Tax=Rugamonas aquatica TaxID=2743357 RepID=A0A6A7NBI2_9BURK|nr:DUF4214 domain-containing protein [Rugamonas aquatica]MQA42453.1 DUF4214 domain-containing protein [Rugamonas aquatica]
MPDTNDSNNISPTIDTIAIGGTARGSFESKWDSDRFKVHLEAGTSYVFSMTSLFGVGYDYILGNANLNLYYNNVSVVAAMGDNDAGPAIAYQPAISGDYFIAAELYDAGGLPNGKLDYQISAAIQQPDALSADIHTTGVLTAGGIVTGRFDVAGDVDWYKFHAEAGQHYTFSFPNESLLPTFFSIYDAQGKELTDSYIPLELATAGDYFIAVGGNAVGDYSMHANNRVDDYSANDSSAGVIVAGGQATGRLEYGVDQDRFHMQVQAGQIYTITLSGDQRDKDILHLRILDEQGKEIADATPRPERADLLPTTFTATTSGTYSIVVSVFEHRHAGHDPYTIKASNPIPNDAGTAGNDILLGKNNGAAIHGGAGTDTVVLDGSWIGYNIVQRGGHAEVSQLSTGGTNILDGVERLLFDDKSIALDVDGVGGKAYRLYQAAFNRAPDESGLGYWIANMDKGLSLHDTAGYFLASEEFGRRYGANLSNEDFVTQLYSNVLHRAPDAEGYAYWLHDLQIGVPRANLLVNFSESPENQAALIQVIGNGFSYIPYSA